MSSDEVRRGSRWSASFATDRAEAERKSKLCAARGNNSARARSCLKGAHCTQNLHARVSHPPGSTHLLDERNQVGGTKMCI